ncbi:MAG: AMP-binding protein, partial [Arcobacter sp.]|nr:AMP-binding protein [Arcobacter sp.]
LKLDVEIKSSQEYVAPRDEIEEKLANIFSEVLNVEKVGIYDNFFELGGHSLLIIKMINSLNKIGLTISIQDIFSSPRLIDMKFLLKPFKENSFETPANLIPNNCNKITPDMLPMLDITQEEINIITEDIKDISNIQDIYPLSSLQKGILFHHLLNNKFDTYVLPSLFVLKNKKRLDDLIDALQFVVNRHDVLRTSIQWIDIKEAVQVVYKEVPLVAKEITISQDEDIKTTMLSRIELTNLYMDLTIAPLLQIEYAIDENSNKCYVIFKLHHIVCDHVSLDILVREITAYLDNQTNHLPEPVPYRNFIAQGIYQKNQYDEELFFKEKLFNITEPTLPYGLSDAHGDGTRIIENETILSKELSKQIRLVCLKQGVTPAAFFHVAFAIVLSKVSSKDDVVFGTVLSGRYQGNRTIENMFGMFINTLPIRVSLEDTNIKEVIKEVQKYLLDLLDYEQTSLAFAQSCSELENNTALFSAMFNYRHSAAPQTQALNDDMELLASYERATYPFNLMVDDYGEDFGLNAHIDQSVNAKRVSSYILKTIEEIIDALDSKETKNIQDISILTQKEQTQLTVEYNQTKTSYAKEKTIHQLFEEQVVKTPNSIAVVYEDKQLTYKELNEKANALANHLLTFNIQPD